MPGKRHDYFGKAKAAAMSFSLTQFNGLELFWPG
jgi:hypothetical protein